MSKSKILAIICFVFGGLIVLICGSLFFSVENSAETVYQQQIAYLTAIMGSVGGIFWVTLGIGIFLIGHLKEQKK